MAKLSDADVRRINAQLAADPEWRQLNAAHQATMPQWGERISPQGQAVLDYYKAHNIPVGPNSGNNVSLTPDGQLVLNHEVKKFWKSAAKSAAMMYGLQQATGGASGPGGVSASPSGGTGDPNFEGPVNQGGSPPPVSPPSTGGRSSVLHDYLPLIIGGVSTVVGAKVSAKGQTDAAKTQAESADKALAVQKEMRDLQRADNASYRQIGVGGINNLGYLSGIDMTPPAPATGTPPSAATTPAPYVVPGAKDAKGNPFPGAGMPDPYGPVGSPPSNLSQLSQPAAQNGMVKVRSPQGSIGVIPASMLQHALAAGGTQV